MFCGTASLALFLSCSSLFYQNQGFCSYNIVFTKKSVISNLLLYFQRNLFIVAFNHLLLYFLLFKLDLCFSSDIWCRLNKVRSLWLIFAAAWFHFNIIAFGEIWSQIYFRSMMSKDHILKIKTWKLNTHTSKTITIRIKNIEVRIFYFVGI